MTLITSIQTVSVTIDTDKFTASEWGVFILQNVPVHKLVSLLEGPKNPDAVKALAIECYNKKQHSEALLGAWVKS